MKKVKITGNILLVTGLILLTVSTLLDLKVPIIGIVGIIIACTGFLFFFDFLALPILS